MGLCFCSLNISKFLFICLYMYVYVGTYVYVSLYICMYVSIGVYVYGCFCMYIYIVLYWLVVCSNTTSYICVCAYFDIDMIE